MIIGYIENLRDKGKAHQTIATLVTAILHFFVTLNDIPLNKRKITRFIPSDEEGSTRFDKAYDIDDILRLLNACDIRTKVIVLLMALTGMGIGAIEGLRFGHLTSIPEYNLYQIEVYAHSKKMEIRFVLHPRMQKNR
jgi:integrase